MVVVQLFLWLKATQHSRFSFATAISSITMLTWGQIRDTAAQFTCHRRRERCQSCDYPSCALPFTATLPCMVVQWRLGNMVTPRPFHEPAWESLRAFKTAILITNCG